MREMEEVCTMLSNGKVTNSKKEGTFNGLNHQPFFLFPHKTETDSIPDYLTRTGETLFKYYYEKI